MTRLIAFRLLVAMGLSCGHANAQTLKTYPQPDGQHYPFNFHAKKTYAGNIKDVFAKYGETLTWERVKTSVGIPKKCSFDNIKRRAGYLNRVEGIESGVVDREGERLIFQKSFGNLVLRFTFDRVSLNGGLTPFCFYELFIRDLTTNEPPRGFLVTNDGFLLDIAPERFVSDKDKRKNFDTLDTRVFSGDGCYACHPDASREVEDKYTEDFWGDTSSKRVVNGLPFKGRQTVEFLGFTCTIECTYSSNQHNYWAFPVMFFTTIEHTDKLSAERELNTIDNPTHRCAGQYEQVTAAVGKLYPFSQNLGGNWQCTEGDLGEQDLLVLAREYFTNRIKKLIRRPTEHQIEDAVSFLTLSPSDYKTPRKKPTPSLD